VKHGAATPQPTAQALRLAGNPKSEIRINGKGTANFANYANSIQLAKIGVIGG
jgi:hypothetical protein